MLIGKKIFYIINAQTLNLLIIDKVTRYFMRLKKKKTITYFITQNHESKK